VVGIILFPILFILNSGIIIKQVEILSSGFYDQRLFDLFNKKESGEDENQLDLF